MNDNKNPQNQNLSVLFLTGAIVGIIVVFGIFNGEYSYFGQISSGAFLGACGAGILVLLFELVKHISCSLYHKVITAINKENEKRNKIKEYRINQEKIKNSRKKIKKESFNVDKKIERFSYLRNTNVKLNDYNKAEALATLFEMITANNQITSIRNSLNCLSSLMIEEDQLYKEIVSLSEQYKNVGDYEQYHRYHKIAVGAEYEDACYVLPEECDAQDVKSEIIKRRRIKLIFALIILTGIVAYTFTFIVVPRVMDNDALKYLNLQDYEKTLSQYEKNKNYRDQILGEKANNNFSFIYKLSAFDSNDEFDQKVKYAKYLYADSYLNDKNYSDAIVLFEELGRYKDSSDKIRECWYLKGIEQKNDGNYYDAIELLKTSNNYFDAKEQITLCKDAIYAAAVVLFQDEEYEKSLEVFKYLDNYKDCIDQVRNTTIALAEECLKNDKTSEAIIWYESIGESEKIKEIKYNYVLSHKNRTNITTYDYLVDLKESGYKNSTSIYNSLYAFSVKAWFVYKEHNNCFHYIVSGGPPKNGVNIRVVNKGSWNGGNKYQNENAGDFTFVSKPENEGVEQYCSVSLWYAYKHVITIYNADTGQQLARIVDPWE